MVPFSFRGVLYLDVFGWLSHKQDAEGLPAREKSETNDAYYFLIFLRPNMRAIATSSMFTLRFLARIPEVRGSRTARSLILDVLHMLF